MRLSHRGLLSSVKIANYGSELEKPLRIFRNSLEIDDR